MNRPDRELSTTSTPRPAVASITRLEKSSERESKTCSTPIRRRYSRFSFVPGGGDDGRAPAAAGELDRRPADAAGRGVDQHRLAARLAGPGGTASTTR